MPELPEVQTIVNDLIAEELVGKTIVCAAIAWPRSIAEPTPALFCRQIKGRAIHGITRRAKYIVIALDPPYSLIIHLRMTGRLHFTLANTGPSPHERVSFTLSDHRTLSFLDTRKFGRVWLTTNAGSILGKLGPEPLDTSLSPAQFGAMLSGTSRQLKPLLLDQTFLAGLGNIYVDEALFGSGLHPQTRSDTLSAKEAGALLKSIRRALKSGIKNGGTSLGSGKSNYSRVSRGAGENRSALKVFRRTGLPCPACTTPIERLVVAQRSTHVCPKCQRCKGSR